MEKAREKLNGLAPRVERAMGEGLCPRCLGRLFARLGHGYDNRQRGMALAMWARGGKGAPRAEARDVEGAPKGEEPPSMDEVISAWRGEGEPDHVGVEPADCSQCRGLMGELVPMAEAVASKLTDLEFQNYLIGTKYDPAILSRQEELWELVGAEEAEHIKLEVNREVGKLVGGLTGSSVEFKRPDVTILLDTRFDSVHLQFASIYIYGLYRKLERGLPQTRWPCRVCGGIGCRRCGFRGRLYERSVQDLVAGPLMEASGARDNAFHGMGREDIDARMLGEGRPFILELVAPRVRNLDLPALQEAVNRENEGCVEVAGLRPSSWEEVQALKESAPDKSYTAKVAFSQAVSEEKLKMVEIAFAGTPIEQRTPERVSHRRADLVRERTVRSLNVEPLGPCEALVHVRAEAGTYIKELIHGDGGRTRPNVSDLLGVPCRVIDLDVTAVHLADGGKTPAPAHEPAGK